VKPMKKIRAAIKVSPIILGEITADWVMVFIVSFLSFSMILAP
jgi:hypothetical protein